MKINGKDHYKNLDNITGWYDGWIFMKLFDPINRFFKPVSGLMEEGSSAIDIGCGTGSLALKLSKVCSHVTGIDISSRMISTAIKRKEKTGSNNVDFIHLNAAKLSDEIKRKYDYAIFSFVLHEMPEYIRNDIIEEAKKIAAEIIINDFVSPMPDNIYRKVMQFVEFTAGVNHYRNFKSWIKLGGIDGFAGINNLKTENEKLFKIGTGKTVKYSFDI